MNSLEELRSKIELMKQALLFYGNKENYIEHKKYEEPSLIQADNGSQARFALKQLDNLDEMNEEMGQEYMEFFKKEANKSNTPENIMKLINEIKNIDDIDNQNL